MNDQKKQRVSVLLPTFNRGRYLAAAIDSLLAQSTQPYEIIVIDNGSTDDTPQVLAQYGARIRRVNMPNRGKTAAINLGLSIAEGDYIWIMDDDDIVPVHALHVLLSPFQVNPSLGFSYGGLIKFVDGALLPTAALASTLQPRLAPEAPASLFLSLLEDCFITGQPCVLYRREALQGAAPFDESIRASVDYNMLLRVARYHDGVDVRRTVLFQRQHGGPRGPACEIYDVGQRAAKWRAYDQKIVLDMLSDMGAQEFLPAEIRKGRLSRRDYREAGFQKAVIYARKDLWPQAIEALANALSHECRAPLRSVETAILGRMMLGRYGFPDLTRTPVLVEKLAQIGDTRVGRDVIAAIASAAPYLLKTMAMAGRLDACVERAALFRTLVGGRELVSTIATRLMGKLTKPMSATADRKTQQGQTAR